MNDDDETRMLITEKTARFAAGLAPKKWTEQLEELRALPETPPAEEATA